MLSHSFNSTLFCGEDSMGELDENDIFIIYE